MRAGLVGFLLSATLISSGCAEEVARGNSMAACGFPTPSVGSTDEAGSGVNIDRYLAVPGTEIGGFDNAGGVEVAVLHVPVSVEDAYDAYKQRLAGLDMDIVAEDFEGFEAELYLRERGSERFVSVQVLATRCEDASLIRIMGGKLVPQPPMTLPSS